jgi:nucleoid-associated protein YgaU
MKNLILTAVLLTLGLIAVGCANNNKNAIPKNESVTELNVAPVPPREGGYAAAPVASAPAAAPIYVEPAVTQTPAAAPAPVAAGAASPGASYTVKKGDTLFSISKNAYGNGNQWQRIAQANPGLSPTTLKAGKTIVLP